MRKIFFLFILGIAVLPGCFSQNMLIAGGDYNPLSPDFWNGNIGFNFGVLNKHIQDDVLLTFGGIRINNGQAQEPFKILFGLKDKLYYSLDWDIIGFRAGVSASLGVYESPDFPQETKMFFNAAGLVGLVIFPKSLVSFTLDVCPGFIMTFTITDAPGGDLNDSGFMLPLSLGIRLNLDKL